MEYAIQTRCNDVEEDRRTGGGSVREEHARRRERGWGHIPPCLSDILCGLHGVKCGGVISHDLLESTRRSDKVGGNGPVCNQSGEKERSGPNWQAVLSEIKSHIHAMGMQLFVYWRWIYL